MEYDLFKKTELWIKGISLENVDLGEIATIVAETLNLERNELLVTDVQGENLVVDILRSGLNAHDIIGKEEQLLRRLSAHPGVTISEKTSVGSQGLLSWIALDYAEGEKALKKSEEMAKEIQVRLLKTAVVFSSGTEVANGQVMDTNTPTISRRLKEEGYSVKVGPTLKDDEVLIAAHLRQAVDEGYGLVITTGGVGAEDKDRTIEAVLMVDPEAVVLPVFKYQLGVGRHQHKDSVRIAIGKISQTLIVALPGPNDEVQIGLDSLVKGLASHLSKDQLAENIAASLKNRLKEKISS
ncbi:MAG: competence/damage-inducible protein A [Syntrophaceae bacterium]|nr:competence/damage-inducible protein A [Syntrophaceae bacterium]